MANKNIAQLWVEKLNNYKTEKEKNKGISENNNSKYQNASNIKRTGSMGVQAEQPK